MTRDSRAVDEMEGMPFGGSDRMAEVHRLIRPETQTPRRTFAGVADIVILPCVRRERLAEAVERPALPLLEDRPA